MPDGPIASPSPRVRIDVHLDATARATALAGDVFRGLTAQPKELPPKWLYDERGSELFSEITRQPEYYLTRRERSLLVERASEIARVTDAETLVELGSGTGEKTRLLLDALRADGSLRRFVPVDVSEETLRASAATIASEYPGLHVHAIVGDLETDLHRLPSGGRRLIAFLGSSIGNMYPRRRAGFLTDLRRTMTNGDAFLLGVDLVKDVSRLEAAYNDAAGVSARFNLNVLGVVNRELGADFDMARFGYVARFDREHEWMEMLLRSTEEQIVTLPAVDLVVPFAEAEEMRTQISAKFRREGIERELAEAGLEPSAVWTDVAGDFAVVLTSVR
jgi:L-histidine N-alpha-methyltransferase